MTDRSKRDQEAMEQWHRRQREAACQDDVQEFLQVWNIGGFNPTVSYSIIVGQFIATCDATRSGRKRGRRIVAKANTRADALESLASAVAEYLHPTGMTWQERKERGWSPWR